MYYINGQYLKEEQALISVLDLSVLRGFSVFEYLRTYKGEPFHLQEHLLRFKYSADKLGLPLPHSLPEIVQIIRNVHEQSGLSDASIKILLTGGVSPDHFTPTCPHLIVFAYPFAPYPNAYFTDGIKVITTPLKRSLPHSKTTQYAPGIVAMQQAKIQGAKEALYLSSQGEILEATTSNFFAFKGGTLHTCESDEVLIGITRQVVLRLASPHFPISTQPLHQNQIPDIDEAFITASNKEIMPVIQIDSTPIKNGKVGPLTKKMIELFQNYTQSLNWPPLHIQRYLDTPPLSR